MSMDILFQSVCFEFWPLCQWAACMVMLTNFTHCASLKKGVQFPKTSVVSCAVLTFSVLSNLPCPQWNTRNRSSILRKNCLKVYISQGISHRVSLHQSSQEIPPGKTLTECLTGQLSQGFSHTLTSCDVSSSQGVSHSQGVMQAALKVSLTLTRCDVSSSQGFSHSQGVWCV